MKNLLMSSYLLMSAVVNVCAQVSPIVRLQSDVIVTLPTGAGLAAIADGDFNHDGRRDLAVCQRSLGQVALYMRSAAGTYPTAKFTYAVGQSPTGLVAFNLNPRLTSSNLMALSGPSSQWTLLRDDQDSTGNLMLKPYPLSFGTGEASIRPQLQLADVNQDGELDLAYTYPVSYNSFVQYASLFSLNSAPGNRRQYFTPHFNTRANASSNLTLADFDRDGYLDPAMADSANNLIRFASDFLSYRDDLQTSGRGPVHTAAQDIDGDQLPDLAVAYAASKEVMLLRVNTNFEFTRSYSYALPAAPRRVLLADLNRDFFPELLVVTADNQLRVYQHNGTASSLCYTTIAPQILATGVNPALLQLAYLDNDAYPDIVVGCVGDNTVHTYLNRTFNTVTATQASRSLTGVEIYPTVATNQVTVHYSNAHPLTATLLNELGRSVHQQVLTQATSTLTLGDLPRGLYVLRLIGAEGIRTARIVLQ
jgi:hypothetical protein